MARSQLRSERKVSGGRYKAGFKKKNLHELAGKPALTKVGARRARTLRVKGGNQKVRVWATETANIYNSKTKKYEKAVIKNIVENTANKNFVRRNIMNKGAVVETDKGKARITSRPGQDGTVNAVLI